jgi:WD40-like Beta Propeller Repeat
MFGWDANVFYLTYVFRRASENSILDPYNPGTGTLTNLLRRTFILEPELNPHPLFQAPFAFFFLQPLLTLAILVAPLLALARDAIITSKEVAWFLVAILLASPNTASYVFVVLLLPIALLLEASSRRWALALVVTYILLCLPLRPAWSWLFPKVWLLFTLYLVAGRKYWKNFSARPASIACLIFIAISLWDAFSHQRDYNLEPARKLEPVESQVSSIYASSPAVSREGITFESIGRGGYVLNRSLAFPGHAFHPSAPASGRPIYFELVADGHSRIASFDPKTKALERLTPEAADAHDPVISPDGNRLAYVSRGKLFVHGEGPILAPAPVDDAAWFPDGDHMAFSAAGVIYDSSGMRPLAPSVAGDHSEPAVSPDGKWLAFTATRRGIRHLWIENIATSVAREMTGGSCNSFAPAWELDSKGLVFASDCSRGLGLPRLYRLHPIGD